MPDILFIKTSSLGDVIHHMPAVTDARRHLPDSRLVWVVEEPYAPLVRLHPAMDQSCWCGSAAAEPGGMTGEIPASAGSNSPTHSRRKNGQHYRSGTGE